MANKRRMVVNGVALSLETPIEVSGRSETGMPRQREEHLEVSYAQALEQWGCFATHAVWKRLRAADARALVTREQFEKLRRRPSHSDEDEIIEAIVALSRGGKREAESWR